MRLTLISHFYNEEFLMPFWIRHHKKIFDHAIMIDYQSTDRSVEIIRDLAPDWEIRPTRNENFNCFTVDAEVMDIEQTIPSWKMALNTTEFLLCHDVRKVLTQKRLEFPELQGFKTTGVWIVDRPSEVGTGVDPNKPLIFQRHHGWIESGGYISRQRLVHDQPSGGYLVGRHVNRTNAPVINEMFCCWFGWSPWPQVRQRKLQIKSRMPPEHIGSGMGVEHQVTPEQMDAQFLNFSAHAEKGDLLKEVGYANELALVKQRLYPELE